MPAACRVPTPAERRYGEALSRAEKRAMDRVVAALTEAEQVAAAAFRESGLEGSPPPYGYFVASLNQKLFCTLCNADPDTFAGGDREIAIRVIRNSQDIARHHWGADIETRARS